MKEKKELLFLATKEIGRVAFKPDLHKSSENCDSCRPEPITRKRKKQPLTRCTKTLSDLTRAPTLFPTACRWAHYSLIYTDVCVTETLSISDSWLLFMSFELS